METLHGRLEAAGTDRAMLVTRTVGIDVDELWRWITESDRTAQWYGPWRTADGAAPTVGDEVLVTMSQEEGSMESGMRVEACEPPRRLALTSSAPAPFNWPISLLCEPADEGSTITLRHDRIPGDVPLADLGAGWEFYLARLVAAIDGSQAPSFEECVETYGEQYARLG